MAPKERRKNSLKKKELFIILICNYFWVSYKVNDDAVKE